MQLPDIALQKTPAVVLVADVAESLALMAHDEATTVARWRAVAARALDELPLRWAGRVVKTLGDGLVVQFRVARRAAEAAAQLHRWAAEVSTGGGTPLRLRIGIHQGSVFADELDIYGNDVTLASRVATLAGPGETTLTPVVRDALLEPFDGQIEDLGECLPRHAPHALRAYRLGPAAEPAETATPAEPGALFMPTVAVVPFSLRWGQDEAGAVGELVADALIVQLGRGRRLRMISRLSTTGLRGRPLAPDQFARHLGAQYLLTGSYAVHGARLVLFWELTDLRDGRIAATSQAGTSVAELLDPASGVAAAIASDAQEAILHVEHRRVQTLPMPSLESYSLLLGGIRLLHQSTREAFERSFQILSHLADRHPQAVEPRIWLAKWYALRAVQGLTPDRTADAGHALACTARALDRDPDNSMAMAMEGLVHCHLTHDYAAGEDRFRQALDLNPSETFAHLFRGVVLGIAARFDEGLAEYDLASSTSPLDPARYMFDTIGGYLALGAGRHGRAIELARRSLRFNREHAHTWRVLTIAQAESGALDEARASVQHVRRLQPGLTVSRYLADRADDPARVRFARALGQAGLPLQ